MTDQTVHATVNPTVERLTDQLLNWFGFVYAYNYPMRPVAMIVACMLYAQDVTPDTLTRTLIEDADRECGGKLTAMWEACHPLPESGRAPSQRS